VVENFVFTTRITVILTLEASDCMSQCEHEISQVSKCMCMFDDMPNNFGPPINDLNVAS